MIELKRMRLTLTGIGILIIPILFSFTNVSAEPYRITGTATFSNSPPVSLEEVSIQCSEFEYDCHSFEGIGAETNRYGEFEISIELDETYDGAELILTLLDESFIHIIDLESSRSSPSNSVKQDIELEQKAPPSPVFTGLGCAFFVFAIAFLALFVRPRNQITARNSPQTRTQDIVVCPICRGRLEKHLLIRHLIVEHDVFPDEAADLSRSVNIEEE